MNSLFLILFFITIGSGIINPLIGPLIFSEHGFFGESSFDYKMHAYALIMGGYALGTILGNLTWGIISDKIGGRKAIIWALLGSLIGYLLCFISLFYSVFILFLLGRCLDGLMTGRRAIVLAMIVKTSKEDTTTVFRYSEITNAAGLFLGPALCGLLVNFPQKVPLYYYSSPLLIMGLIMVFNIILIGRQTTPIKVIQNPNDQLLQVQKTFFNIRLLSSYFMFFILQLGWYLYFLAITPYIIVEWKFTPLGVGIFFSGLILLYIFILLWVFPGLKKIMSEGKLSLLSLIIGGVSMILMGSDTEHYYLFLIYNIGIVIAISCNIPIFMAKITRLKGNDEQGKTIGIQNTFIGFAWLFSVLIIASGVLMSTLFLLSGMLLILLFVVESLKI